MKTHKRRNKTRLYTALFGTLFILLSSCMIIQIVHEYRVAFATSIQLTTAKEKKKQLKKQKQQLKQEKNNYSNSDYLQLFYHGQCLLTQDDEQIFKFTN